MVLDAGRIVRDDHLTNLRRCSSKCVISQVEFDTPAVLLKKEGGMLKALVEGSGDKAVLYEMAENPNVLR